MITVYETAYYGPTDHRGQRIKVTNKRTGNSRWHHWDYAVGWGQTQHEWAVRQCALGDIKDIQIAGETKKGWLFAVTKEMGA